MGKWKWIIGVLAIAAAYTAVSLVLSTEYSLVTHPKGTIAQDILTLIITNVILMLLILVPTLILVLAISWRYRADNPKVTRDLKKKEGVFQETLLWVIPSIIVVIMAVITWDATHALDPYKVLEHPNPDKKPLTIQVVALNWKWLFIYPEQGIATVNYVQFPENTVIHFALAADGSPMNSFWIPQLSGQIYCMTGMETPLYLMAEGVGTYSGKAAEINGDGYAKMRFTAQSTTQQEFDEWVSSVKLSPLRLTHQTYEELLKPSVGNSVALYSYVEKDHFNDIIMKYMHPPTHKLEAHCHE